MRNKLLQANIDNSDPANYPDGRIKDDNGSGNGTAVNEQVYGDIHEMIAKLMRLYGFSFNGLPDNETNGYQSIDALRALASKNDFILPVTSVSSVLNVPIKLASMLENEQVICKASIPKGAETEIKGSDGTQFVVSFIGDFKANEYIRLIKNASGVTIVRLVDLVNLDLAVSEFLFLKKSTQVQEDAGAIETAATTPLTNKTAFAKRVTGTDSSTYLATPTNDGLLSKEDKIIINGIGSSPVKNIGWFSGLDVGTTTGALATSGNITSATVADSDSNSIITVNLANAMSDLNYFVRLHIQSEGNINLDNNFKGIVFKNISTTQIQVSLEAFPASTTSLKIHVETYQL
jgi:hypothetical protein